MDKLNSPFWNVLAIIIITGICFFFYIKAPILENAGMAAIFLNWVPILLGIFTIIIYFLSRIFTKNKNWIISLLGILAVVFFTLSALLSTAN